MSTIKSSNEHLTLNADGSSKDIKFQANGVEKASISSSGAFTSTTIDATKLTGALPAISGANLTGLSSFNPDGAVTINDSGADVDFRVESDTLTHAFEVNGASGLVGIGCAETVTGLDVDAHGEGTNIKCFIHGNNDGGDVMVAMANTAAATSSNESVTLHLQPMNAGKGVLLRAHREGNFNSAANSSASFELVVNKANAAISALRVDPAGIVSLYQDSTNHAAGDDYVVFRHNGGNIGAISKNGTTGVTYATSSDYRLKENVDYTWDATTRLKQLKPARFNFIADEDNTLVDGFIAHEVSSVVPEAVTGIKDAMVAETFYTEDDVETQGDSPTKLVGDVKTYSASEINPQGIDQSKLVPLLVKTIQELEARITALES
jgi:hypothetical protein